MVQIPTVLFGAIVYFIRKIKIKIWLGAGFSWDLMCEDKAKISDSQKLHVIVSGAFPKQLLPCSERIKDTRIYTYICMSLFSATLSIVPKAS